MRYAFASLSRDGAIEHRVVESNEFKSTHAELTYDGDVLFLAWEPLYSGRHAVTRQSLEERLQRKWAERAEAKK